MFKIYILLHQNINSFVFQYLYILLILANLGFMPVVIYISMKRIREILNPEINNTYSRISIWILRLLIVTAVLQIVQSGVYLGVMIFYQMRYNTFEDFQHRSHRSMPELIISQHSRALLTDSLQIFQIFEWLIIIHMMTFQKGKRLQ